MNLKTLRENLQGFTAAGRLVLHTYTSPRRNAWSAPVPATPQLERVPIADIVPHGDELHVYLDTWPVRKPKICLLMKTKKQVLSGNLNGFCQVLNGNRSEIPNT